MINSREHAFAEAPKITARIKVFAWEKCQWISIFYKEHANFVLVQLIKYSILSGEKTWVILVPRMHADDIDLTEIW